MDAKVRAGRQKVEAVVKFLAFKKIPPHLATRIVDFYDYQASIFEQEAQLKDLPLELKMQLSIHVKDSRRSPADDRT